MNIYTITLNPAYDMYALADSVSVGHENLVEIISRDIGGKGLNISRALMALGTQSVAVLLVGEDNSDEFKSTLCAEGINALILELAGRIRENLTVRDAHGKETRISFKGFSVSEEILNELDKRLDITESDVVAFCGRIPDGMGKESVISHLLSLKARGARLLIDSKSFSRNDLSRLMPWLVKPNEEEITEYVGKDVSTVEDAISAAKSLIGFCSENVIVSLGSRGAVLAGANDSNFYYAAPPKIEPLSTIGAGDCLLSGFLHALKQGMPYSEALKTAVATGSAACLTQGTKPPQKALVEKIIREVTLDIKESR